MIHLTLEDGTTIQLPAASIDSVDARAGGATVTAGGTAYAVRESVGQVVLARQAAAAPVPAMVTRG